MLIESMRIVSAYWCNLGRHYTLYVAVEVVALYIGLVCIEPRECV